VDSVNPEEATPVAVLVVDDEPVIADTLAIILRQRGMTTVTAYDGDQAIEMTRLHHPKLILMNVFMPRTDGIQASIQIRREFPEVHIVLHSGNQKAGEYARQNGFEVSLAKPIALQRMFDILAAHGISPATNQHLKSA
jgi:CheY-like chemotaxis protein